MKPATQAKRYFENTKMMIVSANDPNKISHKTVAALPDILTAGDLLVVNSSGTLPSSFRGIIRRLGLPIEIRLAAFRGENTNDLRRWSAVSFGHGDWRWTTETRGLPPPLIVGDEIEVSPTLRISVTNINPGVSRLLQVEFHSQQLTKDLYTFGQPIQYSYHEKALEIWDQQTLFAGPPISVEPPSASFPLTWDLLLKLQQRGVRIVPILHSAGISSTGSAELDRLLPLEEYFEVPLSTMDAIQSARQNGGRIVALGTSVTRAVESAFAQEKMSGLTDLKLGPTSKIRAVDILITGMHEEGSSHSELMKAFCGCEMLSLSETQADERQYLSHEFGDLTLLDCGEPKDIFPKFPSSVI